jgi:Mg2+-importing ATPase
MKPPADYDLRLQPLAYGHGLHLDGRSAWWRLPLTDNLSAVDAGAEGLTTAEATVRQRQYGKNTFRDTPTAGIAQQLFERFRNPLVLLLLFAGLIAALTGDVTSAVIIAAMVLLSVALDFIQSFRAEQTARRLKQSVDLRASVLRDGRETDLALRELVPGDVVRVRAGQLVPADGRLLTARDLFVQQSALTGEAYPVEKTVDAMPSTDELQQAQDALFMGTSVVSGEAAMLVCVTGVETQIGHVVQAVAARRSQTAFDRGIAQFGRLIVHVTSVLVLFVMVANLLAHKPVLESFLFALALAVGLTPELLPMIVTVTLTRGALRLSRQKVVVKRLSAIQELGAMDVLCTDKTGTLTEGRVCLERHLDIDGNDNASVLQHAWLNSYFESGVRTPLEDAVLAHETLSADGWKKIDEVPFDFERRRLSVLLEQGDGEGARRWLILKGAPADVLAHCTTVAGSEEVGTRGPDALVPLDEQHRATAQRRLDGLETEGFRTLAVAVREMPLERDHARLDDENGLTLLGFLGFLDPPKTSAAGAIAALTRHAVTVKVVTGDSELVTRYICQSLGMPVHDVLTGTDIAQMDDAALRQRVESANLFCRVNPLQKNRVILALKANGHVVGYLGDGINDAPALHNADVGVSVDTAADVAREAADLILLQQDLMVLAGGVLEGRRTFGNVRKYIMMGTSSNFGNMFSMAGAAVFLPFLPMKPIQILLNNFLYDLSEAAIPLDAVDAEELLTPQRWDMRFLRDFMLTMGPISSLFDFLTFYLLLQVMHAHETLFQTGWFIESLATQILVIFVIRTRANPFSTPPHPVLLATSLAAIGCAIALPVIPWGAYFGFAPLPSWYFGALGMLVAGYLIIVQIVKVLFYRRERRTAGRAA